MANHGHITGKVLVEGSVGWPDETGNWLSLAHTHPYPRSGPGADLFRRRHLPAPRDFGMMWRRGGETSNVLS